MNKCDWCQTPATLTKAPKSKEMLCSTCRATIAYAAIISGVPE